MATLLASCCKAGRSVPADMHYHKLGKKGHNSMADMEHLHLAFVSRVVVGSSTESSSLIFKPFTHGIITLRAYIFANVQ
jgi:hypothetical protein